MNDLYRFDMALTRPVFYMMRKGIRVDPLIKERLARETHEKWDHYQTLLNEVAGRYVNVGSSKQVAKLLYGEFGVKERRKDKKVTTDEDALRAIMAEAEFNIGRYVTDQKKYQWSRIFLTVKLMLKIREARKIISSYTGCPESGCDCENPSLILFDEDGRMRSTISVGGTETMRFSHSKTLWGTGMNLATVPHPIRVMFIADDGWELCETDLNRGESWVYAHLSEDPELMRIHQEGDDFHSVTAAAIQGAFGEEGLTAEEITKRAKAGDPTAYKIRYLGKKVNHASSYRMGPFRGAEVINEEADSTNITITPGQMRKAQALWRQKYPGIEWWWSEIDRELESSRTLITPYGRRRMFYGFMGEHLKKEATAYVPQSTSVDYMNRGMLRLFEKLIEGQKLPVELLHQNHDSILFQYPIGLRDLVLPAVMELLTSTVRVRGHQISIPVEASIGQNWGDFHKTNNPDGLKTWHG